MELRRWLCLKNLSFFIVPPKCCFSTTYSGSLMVASLGYWKKCGQVLGQGIASSVLPGTKSWLESPFEKPHVLHIQWTPFNARKYETWFALLFSLEAKPTEEGLIWKKKTAWQNYRVPPLLLHMALGMYYLLLPCFTCRFISIEHTFIFANSVFRSGILNICWFYLNHVCAYSFMCMPLKVFYTNIRSENLHSQTGWKWTENWLIQANNENKSKNHRPIFTPQQEVVRTVTQNKGTPGPEENNRHNSHSEVVSL